MDLRRKLDCLHWDIVPFVPLSLVLLGLLLAGLHGDDILRVPWIVIGGCFSLGILCYCFGLCAALYASQRRDDQLSRWGDQASGDRYSCCGALMVALREDLPEHGHRRWYMLGVSMLLFLFGLMFVLPLVLGAQGDGEFPNRCFCMEW